ncbi:MAG: AmmeMemoRadiSam system protein B [Candidatus Rokubacteria bacterium]|nr:AmmeMemoRadiSam system protein B [Candidatus Rokubacteria bacterium]
MSQPRPRLRHVEAFPIEHESRPCIGLRDPSGYTSAVILVPWAAREILARFDGRHSIDDIQAALVKTHGEIVPRETIDGLARALDEQGFLDGPKFAERRRRIDEVFHAASVRAATHAGGAYPGDADGLRRTMDAFFAPPAGPGVIAGVGQGGEPVVGLIAPHIDFHRGGPAYAWAYRDLGERADADLFVIFGTCHVGMPDAFAVTRKAYDTPFGPADVDQDFVEALVRRAPLDCFSSEIAHRNEHSIEFQAVFLRYLFAGRRDFTIVPILTSFAQEALAAGRTPEADACVTGFLDALVDTAQASGRRIAWIAGADLAHVGPRFGDPQPLTPTAMDKLAAEDRAMLDPVVAGDAAGFFASVAADRDRRRICGLSPIWSLLHVLGGRPGELRHYGHTPDPDCVVSFASVVF